MQKRYWVELNKNCKQLVQRYDICQMNNNFRNLPLDCFFIAASQYSGPIALLYNSSKNIQYTFPAEYRQSIIIFSNKGQIKKLIPFQVKQRVIAFQFLEDQSLFIMHASGEYHILDTYSGHKKKSSIVDAQSKQRTTGVSVVKQTLFLIKQKQFGVVRGIFHPNFQAINNVKVSIQNPVFDILTQNGQIQIVYLSRENTIEIFYFDTNKRDTLLDTDFVKTNANNLLCVTKNDKKIALAFSNPLRLLYIQDQKTYMHEPMIQLNEQQNEKVSKHRYKKTYDFGWLGQYAVFSNRKFLMIFDLQAIHLNMVAQKIVFEVDGVRAYSDYHSLYRPVPKIFKQLIAASDGNQQQLIDPKIKPLHNFYWQYLNKKVVFRGQLNFEDKYIEQALETILQCGGLCLDMLQQMQIFKFASFIKTYFKAKTDIYYICNELRSVNNLKYEHLNRMLTLAQFRYIKNLDNDRLIILLLRYNMHFMADQIIVDSEGKQKIFLHWAKCKIEKQDQPIALQEIKDKYSSLNKKIKGTKVFTEIARYCLDRNKANLAHSLIQFQEHPGRKIMVSLLIIAIKEELQLVEKLLQFVQNCGDSFLMFRVIHQLLKYTWLDQILWTNTLLHRPNLQRHYISYLKQNRLDEILRKYYLDNKMLQDIGLWALKLDAGLTQNELRLKIQTDYKTLLPNASAVLRSNKNKTILNQAHKLRLIKEKQQNQITETDLQGFDKDDELEYAAEILIQKNMWNQALKMIRKIKSMKAYMILHRKGQYEIAIRIAAERRDKQGLQFILERCPVQFQQSAKQQMSKIK